MLGPVQAQEGKRGNKRKQAGTSQRKASQKHPRHNDPRPDTRYTKRCERHRQKMQAQVNTKLASSTPCPTETCRPTLPPAPRADATQAYLPGARLPRRMADAEAKIAFMLGHELVYERALAHARRPACDR